MDYEYSGVQINQEKTTDSTERIKAYAEKIKERKEKEENAGK